MLPHMNTTESIRSGFDEAVAVLQAFLESPHGLENVERFAKAATAALDGGNKLMACGNGGSMCDAMHFVEEWTGRFRGNRRPLPAVAFSDPSQLTCIANDFGFDQVFARSVRAVGRKGDLFLAISTSGNSPNVIAAVEEARDMGITTVGLLGKGGGRLAEMVDVPIIVPDATTSDRIQELHIKIIHIVIEAVERELVPENYS